MSDWSAKRVEQLTTLVERGQSAGQIADAIGISRNAVIGKAQRLGLKLHGAASGGRPSGIAKLPKPPKPKRAPPEDRLVGPILPPTDDEIYRAYASAIFIASR